MKKTVILACLILLTGIASAESIDEANILTPEDGEQLATENGEFTVEFNYETIFDPEVESERDIALQIYIDEDEKEIITEETVSYDTGEYTNTIEQDFVVETVSVRTIELVSETEIDNETHLTAHDSVTLEFQNESAIDTPNDFLKEEQTINLEEPKEELSDEFPIGILETIIPAQTINIEILGDYEEEIEEALPEDQTASVELDSDLEEVTVAPDERNDPTLSVEIEQEFAEDVIDPDTEMTPEEVRERVREGQIEYEAHTLFNRFVVFTAEQVLGL